MPVLFLEGVSSQVVASCLAYLKRTCSNKQSTTEFFALGRCVEKSVLFSGFILLWGGIKLSEKCLGEAHTRVMENCCGVRLKTTPQTCMFKVIYLLNGHLSLVIKVIQSITAISIDSVFPPSQVTESTNTHFYNNHLQLVKRMGF